MADSQIELNEKRKALRESLFVQLPEVTQHLAAQGAETYTDGALDGKTKRLMALVIGLSVGCSNCVLSQTEHALNLGATREEILEALGVVMSMRGTTGVGESLRVIEFLDELGVD